MMEETRNRPKEKHYYSDRLVTKLDRLRTVPTTIVEAPSGYGKTTALRDYMRRAPVPEKRIFWLTVTEEPLSSSYRRFAHMVEQIDPIAGQRLRKFVQPNTISLGEICDAIKAITCAQETYFVIDNAHLFYQSLPLCFLNALIEHGGDGLRLVLIAQMLAVSEQCEIACRSCLHITAEDLRLTAQDIRLYFAASGATISLEIAKRIFHYTNGWIIAVRLQFESYLDKSEIMDTDDILSLLERLLWDGLNDQQQQFFLRISLFETVTRNQICLLLGVDDLPDYAQDALRNPLVKYYAASERYELHSLLLKLLARERRALGSAFERACHLAAGDLCRAENRNLEAMQYYQLAAAPLQMLSLDLSALTYERINGVPFVEIAENLLALLPAKVRQANLLKMLQLAWIFLSFAKYNTFDGLMLELDRMLSENAQQNRRLRGEWFLLSCWRAFPDLVKMTALLQESKACFQGASSQVIVGDMPWSFGTYYPLACFLTTPGQADATADRLEAFSELHAELTAGNGRGAAALYRAELAYNRGQPHEAEILAYQATYLARQHRQGILELGATGQLAEVSTHKADPASWHHAIDSMENIAFFPTQDPDDAQITLDIIRGTLLNELQHTENVAEWLKEGDFQRVQQHVLAPVGALFVHLNYLMLTGQYQRLVGTFMALDSALANDMPFSYMLFLLSAAIGNTLLGNEAEARKQILHAMDLGLPDGLVFAFASYSQALPVIDDLLVAHYPHLAAAYQETKSRFLLGLETLQHAHQSKYNQLELSDREREVAELAAQGLHNAEIAKQLFLSENTVRAHLRNVFRKLDIDRRSRLAERLQRTI